MAKSNMLAYFDPCMDSLLVYDGKTFSSDIPKNPQIASRIFYKDIIHHSFKVASTISEEELKGNVEIKMYEEAGLDLQKQYKISYVKKPLDFDDMDLIEAFAVEIGSLEEKFQNVIKKYKHIDFLAIPFLSFQTLYSQKIIAAKNDVFVYLGKEDAFVTIYKDGRYLSSKSIPTLNDISTRLSDSGLELDCDALIEHLHNKGIESSSYERGETLLYQEIESIFSEIFSKINDVVVYNRSVFGFDEVHRIFLSTTSGRVRGLREFSKSFGFEDVEILDFNLFKEKSQDLFYERIVAAYVHEQISLQSFEHNFTVFHRSPPFYKRESGRIIAVAVSLLLLSGVYVGLLYYQNNQLQLQAELLEGQYSQMQRSASRYKREISAVKKETQTLEAQKSLQDESMAKVESSVFGIEKIRNTRKVASSFILDVHTLLAKYDLSVRSLEVLGLTSMSIQIVAPSSKRAAITAFMKNLMAKGYVGITTDEILSEDNVYISTVAIQR